MIEYLPFFGLIKMVEEYFIKLKETQNDVSYFGK